VTIDDAAIKRTAAMMVRRKWLPAGWQNEKLAPVGKPDTIRRHIRDFLEAAEKK
jgi:hypothetical protein